MGGSMIPEALRNHSACWKSKLRVDILPLRRRPRCSGICRRQYSFTCRYSFFSLLGNLQISKKCDHDSPLCIHWPSKIPES